MHPHVTQVEIAALLATAQDHAFGQPAGSQLRATVVAHHLAVDADVDREVREAAWWATALRFLGCTGHAHEVAVVFGDEIELRNESLLADSANPSEFLRLSLRHAGGDRTGLARIGSIVSMLAGGKKAAEMNFRTACEVADALSLRLGLDDLVRASLAANFERWNGRGLPSGVKGTAIPLPMRIAQLAQELEVLGRVEGLERAIEKLVDRRGKAYDPDLVDVAVQRVDGWWAAVEHDDPWDAALAVAPPCGPLDEAGLRESVRVVADFADLKSPWTSGHSRAVAELAVAAIGAEVETAALLHDLGCVAVPNTIWDKPGALTRDERDRAESHSLVTEQLVRRVPGLAAAATVAGSAHERLDGSGYHRRATGSGQVDAARILAAADCLQALTSERPHRPASSREAAASELRAMAAAGRLDGEAVERVLAAAGQPRAARPTLPAGLTKREVEVLQLLAQGLTVKQVSERLVISAKTADHHVQHIYTKIGVSTRGAATLFAVEHGLLPVG